MSGIFSDATFKFLAQLEKNNNREWFSANKDLYEKNVKEPCLEFIDAIGPQLRKLSPNLVADSRSLFRIYRDVRFSKDKSPYKTHAGIHFYHSAGKGVSAPTLYLHIHPKMNFMGGGIYMPDPKALQKIREAIVDRSSEWRSVRNKVALAEEARLIRPPRGFDAEDPFIEDIKLKHYVASTMLTKEEICSPRFLSTFIDGGKSMQPLMKFLAKAVGVSW